MKRLEKAARNLPILLWWMGLVYLSIKAPSVIFAISVALMGAGPVIYLAKRNDKAPVAPATVFSNWASAYAVMCSMTVLGIAKSALAKGIGPRKHGDVADGSR